VRLEASTATRHRQQPCEPKTERSRGCPNTGEPRRNPRRQSVNPGYDHSPQRGRGWGYPHGELCPWKKVRRWSTKTHHFSQGKRRRLDFPHRIRTRIGEVRSQNKVPGDSQQTNYPLAGLLTSCGSPQDNRGLIAKPNEILTVCQALDDNRCKSGFGFFEAADYLIAIEDLLRQIKRPVIIVIGGFIADGGVQPGNPIKPFGKFDFIAGKLRHPGPN